MRGHDEGQVQCPKNKLLQVKKIRFTGQILRSKNLETVSKAAGEGNHRQKH